MTTLQNATTATYLRAVDGRRNCLRPVVKLAPCERIAVLGVRTSALPCVGIALGICPENIVPDTCSPG